ncbi:hypothetical protein HanPI659440_Chr02g0085281 [Helianthus annuus]|nr:hypothetical protein HanPI659440_Chr02g0085281 [Helianthus annuus]
MNDMLMLFCCIGFVGSKGVMGVWDLNQHLVSEPRAWEAGLKIGGSLRRRRVCRSVEGRRRRRFEMAGGCFRTV